MSIMSESLPAIKFDIKVAMEPINKAIPILSKPTCICSAITGISGSTVMPDNPKRIKIK